jgi:hypothetical protein
MHVGKSVKACFGGVIDSSLARARAAQYMYMCNIYVYT